MERRRAPNILIVGGNFVGKGAEAMMMTLKEVIDEVAPKSSIYAIPIYEEEEKRLIEYGIIPIRRKNLILIKRILLLIKTVFSPKKKIKLDLENLNEVGSLSNIFAVSDVVIDISGFASGDQWGSKIALNRFIQYSMAKFSGNSIVFMPQSWGPFNNTFVRILTKMLIKTSEYVFAREYLSYNYLVQGKCVNQEKLFYATDIAFHFKAESSDNAKLILNSILGDIEREGPIIAISPNIRIYQRTAGKGVNNYYVKQLFEAIDYILDNTASKVLLIPHEFFKDANDVMLCEMILDHYSGNKRFSITPSNLSASEVKAVIGLCDLIIASRYHSLVAALSMGVVPVIIGWSHKYNELIKLFNLEKLVTDPVNKTDNNLIKVIDDAWKLRTEYKNLIINNLPDVKKTSYLALEKLKELLDKIVLRQKLLL